MLSIHKGEETEFTLKDMAAKVVDIKNTNRLPGDKSKGATVASTVDPLRRALNKRRLFVVRDKRTGRPIRVEFVPAPRGGKGGGKLIIGAIPDESFLELAKDLDLEADAAEIARTGHAKGGKAPALTVVGGAGHANSGTEHTIAEPWDDNPEFAA